MTDAGKNEVHLDEQVEEEEEQLSNGVEENNHTNNNNNKDAAEDRYADDDEGKEAVATERRSRGRGRGRGFHNHGYSHPAHAAAYYHQVREINHLGGNSSYPVVSSAPAIPGVVGRLLKVSAKSNPKTVAGSIAHTCRGGETATLMATGAVSINQAVKAIAIARGYLEENKIDLTVRPEFRNEERGAVTLLLNKAPLRARSTAAPEAAESELRVAQASEPSVVAGSIAKKIRGGERVSIVAIGAAAVTGGLRAVTIGRRYLEKDGLDLTFRPEFVHVSTPDGGSRGDEGQRSAIKLQVLAQQI